MTRRSQRVGSIATAYLFALLLAVPLLAGGCGSRRPGEASYVVKQGGIEIGEQTVRFSGEEGKAVYGATERRPFKVFDTTMYRKLAFSSDLKDLQEYYSSRRVPGAAYRTYLRRSGGSFTYLADELQTFDYQVFPPGKVAIPYEPDSACLMQALADKFFTSGFDQATTLAVIPSRDAVMRELLIQREGKTGLKVTSPGVPEVSIRFGGDGILSKAEGGGLVIDRGRAGSMSSKPFMPTGRARALKEVMVQTPEKLPGGERLELAGSIYIPAGKRPYPAVVLAGDFGPQDRTGGGFLSQIAARLVDDGFAVLTCDRRGVPRSQGDYATYTLESATSDLNAQVDYLVLRGDIDIERIAMVGYGEGGQLASKVAASNPYVSSLVLMATPSVPLFPDLALRQADLGMSAGLLQPAEAAAARIRTETEVRLLNETSGNTLELGGHELFLGWMRSEAANDPLVSISLLEIPVLVAQGGRDGYVPVEEANRIMDALNARGKSTQKLALFEKLGHSFGTMFSEGATAPYRAHPEIDPEVLNAVSSWLKER